jgi:hypothetical protein
MVFHLIQLSSTWNGMGQWVFNLPVAVTETSQEIGQPQGASEAQSPSTPPECNTILGECIDEMKQKQNQKPVLV